MAAGSKIEDDKQEYQYSMPFISPSGHELSFYETPDNQRVVLRHTSGSHIEFKSDGSVFLKAVKDLHVHGSVLSDDAESAGGTAKEADASTLRFDTDLNLEVGGTLSITAKRLEIDISETTNMISGTDTVITANNITEKAYENVSIKGTKSVYVDTKEYREKSISHEVEQGAIGVEKGAPGGLNYMNVHGNFVINNTDPTGGITLMSAGYMHLVCGQERLDLVGQYIPAPASAGLSALRIGTWTQVVKMPTPPMPKNKSLLGDYVFASQGGAAYTYGGVGGSMINPAAGLQSLVTTNNMITTVSAGNQVNTVSGTLTEAVGLARTRTVGAAETVTIAGIQKITAAQIYLN
jgi:hypothetical protein